MVVVSLFNTSDLIASKFKNPALLELTLNLSLADAVVWAAKQHSLRG